MSTYKRAVNKRKDKPSHIQAQPVSLVIASNYNRGQEIAEKYGSGEKNCAIITDPDHLRGLKLYYNEEILVEADLPTDTLSESFRLLAPGSAGQPFKLKFITIKKS